MPLNIQQLDDFFTKLGTFMNQELASAQSSGETVRPTAERVIGVKSNLAEISLFPEFDLLFTRLNEILNEKRKPNPAEWVKDINIESYIQNYKEDLKALFRPGNNRELDAFFKDLTSYYFKQDGLFLLKESEKLDRLEKEGNVIEPTTEEDKEVRLTGKEKISETKNNLAEIALYEPHFTNVFPYMKELLKEKQKPNPDERVHEVTFEQFTRRYAAALKGLHRANNSQVVQTPYQEKEIASTETIFAESVRRDHPDLFKKDDDPIGEIDHTPAEPIHATTTFMIKSLAETPAEYEAFCETHHVDDLDDEDKPIPLAEEIRQAAEDQNRIVANALPGLHERLEKSLANSEEAPIQAKNTQTSEKATQQSNQRNQQPQAEKIETEKPKTQIGDPSTETVSRNPLFRSRKG